MGQCTKRRKIDESSNLGWSKLLKYDNYIDPKFSSSGELRQDNIENGIVPDMAFIDLFKILPNLGEASNFDVFKSYSSGVYLTKCLIASHSINETYQRDMNEIFNRITNGKCYFQRAGVKHYDRALVKSETDYAYANFPRAANVVDYNRCSITFGSAAMLYDALIKFIDLVNKGESKCVKKIVRIKNGFNQILQWKSVVIKIVN